MSEEQDRPVEPAPEPPEPQPAADDSPFELPPLDIVERGLDRLGLETRDGD
jgi:hypothetical protein